VSPSQQGEGSEEEAVPIPILKKNFFYINVDFFVDSAVPNLLFTMMHQSLLAAAETESMLCMCLFALKIVPVASEIDVIGLHVDG